MENITDNSKNIINDLERITDDLERVTNNLHTLSNQVKESNQRNALFIEVYEYLANPTNHDRPNVYLRGSRVENGLLYKDNKLWVDKDLRLDVIREVHD